MGEEIMFFRKLKNELKSKDEQIESLKKKINSLEESLEFVKKIAFKELDDYIAQNFVEEVFLKDSRGIPLESILFQTMQVPSSYGKIIPDEIEVVLKDLEQSFSDRLMEIIREKNLDEVEIYKKADIDRRHFSKIRSNSDYRPTKDTVILLCLSMKLSLEETADLLNRAGFAFSKSSKRDLIAEYFFKKKIYDVIDYKQTLYEYGFYK